jgi:hypothetical protein
MSDKIVTSNSLQGNSFQGTSVDGDRRMNNLKLKKKKKKKMKTMQDITRNA